MMRRNRVDASLFREPVCELGPPPRLPAYVRCSCGTCRECKDNEKWDRIFAKFEVKEQEMGSRFRSPLADL